VRLVLGYGIPGNELMWWVFRYSNEGVHVNNLPLQLCDLTVWMTVLACLTTIPVVVEFAYFAGVAGSGMAILTPDLWTPFISTCAGSPPTHLSSTCFAPGQYVWAAAQSSDSCSFGALAPVSARCASF
jgi:hypothetical protein